MGGEMIGAKRLRVLAIPREYLVPILLGRIAADVAALPADVKLDAVGFDFPSQAFLILAESESFDPVEPTKLAPSLPMSFRVIGDDSWRDRKPML